MGERDGDLIGRLAAFAAAALDVGPLEFDSALREALPFDPVGIAEIAAMAGESKQNANYLMGHPDAPAPVELERMKVWRASEVRAYLATISGKGPDGRRPATPRPQDGREFIPMAEVRVGMTLAAGVVTGVRFSPSGKTVYFTCRDSDGTVSEGRGRDASGKITVFPGPA